MSLTTRMMIVMFLGFLFTFALTWKIRGRGFGEFFGRPPRPQDEDSRP